MSEGETTITLHSSGCSCPACSGKSQNDFTSYNGTEVGGEVGAPSTNGTKEQFADYLTDGFWHDSYGPAYSAFTFAGWDNTSLTFSISNWYSANEKEGIRDAFQQWSDVTGLTFTEVASSGQIYFEAPGGAGETGKAFASPSWYSNGVNFYMTIARVVIDYDSGGFGSDPTDLGDYALMTAIHEIGHALGLGHSGYYNAGQGNPTYANNAQWLNETRQYTLMSYWSASNSGANHLGEYASTPLVMDIYAIQQLYGMNMNTRSGNTVYGFNSTAGRDQFDFTVNVEPVVAIWDGGGTDTLDLSGWSMAQMIDLADGAFSNVGGGTGNLAIAYNAIIENAIGGSGNDTIYGNTANNLINGGLGNDTLYGSTGSDTLDGDGGTDTVNYSYDISAFLVSLVDSVTLTLQHIAQSWIDTIIEVENFIFNGVSYTFEEVQALAYEPETYTMFFKDAGVKYYYQSKELGADTLTAGELNYSGTTGNIATFTRTVDDLTIDITNASAPGSLTLYGLSGDDVMTVGGTHANFVIVYDGKEGDDTLTITGVVGNDTLYGGDGNDTISAGAGNDKLYGQGGNDVLNGDAGADLLSGGDGDDELNGGDGDDDIYGGNDNDTVSGGNGNDRIFGDAGNDVLHGNAGIDRMYGGTGDDIIDGGDDNDTLGGDDGADTIYGGNGNDYIYGNAGADLLYGGAGADAIYGGADGDNINGGDDGDYLYGEAGNDTLNGDAGNDIMYGGDGVDTMNGGLGNDGMYGGTDNDIMNGDDGNDTMRGEAGNDTMHGNDGDDTLFGDADDDTLYGDAGVDKLYGGTGDDTLWGGADDDVLNGEMGSDTLYGEDGNDKLYGEDGDDTIYGGDGMDKIYGGNDNDTLYGGNGADYVVGDAGNDTIYGDAGDDYIYGMDGDDILYGGTGVDLIWGGAGADTFTFRAADLDGNYDYIKDFKTVEGDILDISDLLTGFVDGVSDIDDFLFFTAPNAKGEVVMGVDRDGTGGVHNLTYIGKVYTAGVAVDAQTLYDDGHIIA